MWQSVPGIDPALIQILSGLSPSAVLALVSWIVLSRIEPAIDKLADQVGKLASDVRENTATMRAIPHTMPSERVNH